jgi:hypothetical protein
MSARFSTIKSRGRLARGPGRCPAPRGIAAADRDDQDELTRDDRTTLDRPMEAYQPATSIVKWFLDYRCPVPYT